MDLFSYAESRPYPHSVGYQRRDTSLSAAKSMGGKAPRLQQLVVDQLMLYGPMTADEIADNMGVDRLSIRPRCTELDRLGRIIDSGERRKNASGRPAIVWRVVR